MKIALIGDSTVTDESGWGEAFANRFPPEVRILNFAVNGRSSKSWYDENRLPEVLSAKPDYVFIQFGHNDQPGKGPERETDPRTSYRDYLKIYINELNAIDAQPIIVSSVTRRIFNDEGKIASSLSLWAAAAKAVAEEMNIPFIDLHSSSIKLHNEIGYVASMAFNFEEADTTHLNKKGAEIIAEMVINECKTTIPELFE